MADLDPIEPTKIAPNLAAVPLAPTVWDDLPDGQHAVTAEGVVYQRRGGLWHQDPWYQSEDGESIAAVCADPNGWAYDLGWPRKQVEDAFGPLTPIILPGYPHDDERCRQDSVDADGFRQVCRDLAAAQETLIRVRALADECASSDCIHLNDLWGRLRNALDGAQ